MASITSALQSTFDNIIQDIQLVIDNLKGISVIIVSKICHFCPGERKGRVLSWACVVPGGNLPWILDYLLNVLHAIWFCILEMDNEGVCEENFSSGEYWNKMRKCSVARELKLKTTYSILWTSNFIYIDNFEINILSDGIVKAVSACVTKFCIAFNEPPVPTPKVCKMIRRKVADIVSAYCKPSCTHYFCTSWLDKEIDVLRNFWTKSHPLSMSDAVSVSDVWCNWIQMIF